MKVLSNEGDGIDVSRVVSLEEGWRPTLEEMVKWSWWRSGSGFVAEQFCKSDVPLALWGELSLERCMDLQNWLWDSPDQGNSRSHITYKKLYSLLSYWCDQVPDQSILSWLTVWGPISPSWWGRQSTWETLSVAVGTNSVICSYPGRLGRRELFFLVPKIMP